jgi:hypothetical protein
LRFIFDGDLLFLQSSLESDKHRYDCPAFKICSTRESMHKNHENTTKNCKKKKEKERQESQVASESASNLNFSSGAWQCFIARQLQHGGYPAVPENAVKCVKF